MPIIRNCLICSGEVKTYPSKIKLGRGKYCSTGCANESQRGKHHSPETEWEKGHDPWNRKGYRYTQSRKHSPIYKQIHLPDNPMADSRGYVREHRLVMSEFIGRPLQADEVVHHIDGDGLNNDINNLQLLDKREHDRMNVGLNVHARWKG